MSTIIHRESTAQSSLPAAAPARERRSVSALWRWLRQAVPTVAVVGALFGLAVWGHSTDWTLPKFSTLVGNGETVVKDDAQDILTGSQGDDWFWFDPELDRATDLRDEAFASELDWILSEV